jgi:hypothetical protein
MANDEFNSMMDEYVGKKRKSASMPFSGRVKNMFGQRKKKKARVEQPNTEEYIDVTDESFKNPELEDQKSFLENFFEKFLDIFSSKSEEKMKEDIENIEYGSNDEELPEQECDEVTVEQKDGVFTRVIKSISCFFKKEEPEEEEPELEPETEEIKELDGDVVEVLNIVNELFKKLPQDVKEEFKNSDDFETYARVLKKYHVVKKK